MFQKKSAIVVEFGFWINMDRLILIWKYLLVILDIFYSTERRGGLALGAVREECGVHSPNSLGLRASLPIQEPGKGDPGPRGGGTSLTTGCPPGNAVHDGRWGGDHRVAWGRSPGGGFCHVGGGGNEEGEACPETGMGGECFQSPGVRNHILHQWGGTPGEGPSLRINKKGAKGVQRGPWGPSWIRI